MVANSNRETKPGARIWKSEQGVEERLRSIERWPSVGHLFIERLTHEHAGKTILTDHATGRTWTGLQLSDKILDVASALIDLHDFRPGDHLCINHRNCDTSSIFALAAIVAGGFVSATYKKDPYVELLRLARLSRPRFVLCPADKLHWVEDVAMELDYQITGLAVDSDTFNAVFNYDRRQSATASKLPVSCDDKRRSMTAITMSSGTTGKPKPVAQTHYASLSELFNPIMTGAIDDKESSSDSAAPVVCVILSSFNHASGRMFLFSALASGHHAIVMDDFDVEAYLEVVGKYKLKLMALGTAAFYQVMVHPNLEKYDLSSVKVIQPYGASINYMTELRKFLAKYKHITHIKQVYGSSESGLLTYIPNSTIERFFDRPNANGWPVPGAQIKLIDPESGLAILDVQKPGLAMVKSLTMFRGYYNVELPDKLLRDGTVFDEDGFYNTGDLCSFDEHGEIHFLGRDKETIICRQVSKHHPIFFEELLRQHPAVKEVCVLGIPSKLEQGIQCPRAYVVVRPDFDWRPLVVGEREQPPDVSLDNEQLVFKGCSQVCSLAQEARHCLARELLHWANSRLSWIKQLRGGVCLLDTMPMARASGKVDKCYLRSLTLEQAEFYGDLSE